jgi:hypothetical protein
MVETLNFYESTQGFELDCFVMFSSAASLLGNRGQANYAAANSFMDALAHQRRRAGLTALSISWAPRDSFGVVKSDSRITSNFLCKTYCLGSPAESASA